MRAGTASVIGRALAQTKVGRLTLNPTGRKSGPLWRQRPDITLDSGPCTTALLQTKTSDRI